VGAAPSLVFCYTISGMIRREHRCMGSEDVRVLKTFAREKTKTTVIARKLKRSVGATYQKARVMGVTLGGGRGRKGA
jgi:hypothetical protein